MCPARLGPARRTSARGGAARGRRDSHACDVTPGKIIGALADLQAFFAVHDRFFLRSMIGEPFFCGP